MPNLNPKRFSQPEALCKLRRESLLKWLAPASEYFAAQGIILFNGSLSFEALAAAFANPEPDMPEYLVESLEIINEMADERGMDAILEAATQRGVKLSFPDFCTPADVALEAWRIFSTRSGDSGNILNRMNRRHELTTSTRTAIPPGKEKPTERKRKLDRTTPDAP